MYLGTVPLNLNISLDMQSLKSYHFYNGFMLHLYTLAHKEGD